jgi:outer membrane lipoprotein SlyB
MLKRLIVMILMVFLLSGCALQPSDSFSRRELNQTYRVEMGTVERVRNVSIQGTDSGVGTIGGGALGGIAGGAIGGGRGSDIAAILGVIGGLLIGNAVEQQTTQELGLELTVKLDNGQTALVIQAADPPFQIGDRVRVLSGRDGKTRVTH